MSLPKKVFIRELGPREGFQTLSKVYGVREKLKLIEALSKTGVSEIEIASFVRPDLVPQMADAEKIIKELKSQDATFSALYLNQKGFERALKFKKLTLAPWIYTAASKTFLKKNNNTTQDAFLESIPNWLKLFNKNNLKNPKLMISTVFGCNFEGIISDESVLQIVKNSSKVIEKQGEKIGEISLADTMGWATPKRVKSLVTKLKDLYPETRISLHLHDTRGLGLASAYAALELGISHFDTSVGGLGGCPFAKGAAGNICTEDFVYMLHDLGIETGIDLDSYVKAAQIASEIVGEELTGKYYKAQSGS